MNHVDSLTTKCKLLIGNMNRVISVISVVDCCVWIQEGINKSHYVIFYVVVT
jgi:type IV secretory pathway VirB2 component (pilin)